MVPCRRPAVALGVALWLAGGSASSADLAEHFAAAMARSPAVALAEGEVAASGARSRGADRLYKGAPRLTVGYQSDGPMTDGGFVEQEYEFGAEMWLPGERGAARRESEASQRVALAELDLARLALAGQLRSAFWDLAEAEFLLAIERQALSREVETRLAVERLVAARELPANDLELASAALAARQRAAAALAAEADGRAAALAQLTGIPRSSGAAEAPSAGDAAGAPDEHPEVRAAAARRDMLAAAADRSARDLGASPELSVVMRRERVLDGAPYEESLGLRLTVPFGRSAESDISRFEAAAAASAATLAEARQREQVAAALRLARRALETAENGAALARQERDALARVVAGVESAHREGETSFLELQRARQDLLEAERGLVAAEIGSARARSALLQAEGRLP